MYTWKQFDRHVCQLLAKLGLVKDYLICSDTITIFFYQGLRKHIICDTLVKCDTYDKRMIPCPDEIVCKPRHVIHTWLLLTYPKSAHGSVSDMKFSSVPGSINQTGAAHSEADAGSFVVAGSLGEDQASFGPRYFWSGLVLSLWLGFTAGTHLPFDLRAQDLRVWPEISQEHTLPRSWFVSFEGRCQNPPSMTVPLQVLAPYV